MIRYPIRLRDLERQVDEFAPGWRADAAARTQRFVSAGRYSENSGSWSEIKEVFLGLQFNKCAYCERRLAGSRFGKVEFDVEHYRPKSRVRAWPPAKVAAARGIAYPFPTGGEFPDGYFRLAYHLGNYAAACKTCNSALKSDYFPVAGQRIGSGTRPRDLKPEKPFLPYPLGSGDDDPAKLIGFRGVLPVPRASSGHRFRRAQVTIDFFELDTREELLRERAEQIRALVLAREVAEESANAAKREAAWTAIGQILSPYSPHSSCSRTFDELLTRNRPAADAIFEGINRYIVPQI